MPKMYIKSQGVITSVDIVKKNNPLIKGITRMSEKWHKRWPEIDQPWPMEGTFNPDVIKTIQELVSTYKADQKRGRKGLKRKEKRQTELEILQLFENEGRKLIKAAKDRRERCAEDMDKITKGAPLSDVDPIKTPPPYEIEKKHKKIYPQLPVINQEGNYYIKDEDERIIEMGKAETIIKTYPSSKSKKRMTCRKTRSGLRKGIELEDDDCQSDLEGTIGGYDPVVRRILTRAERKGGKGWRKKDLVDVSSTESEESASDGDSESEGTSSWREAASGDIEEEDRQRALEEVERSIDQCFSYMEKSSSPASQNALESQMKELQLQKKELKKKSPRKSQRHYQLRSRKGKMCPVVIRGQNLDYKPWQSTDMSDILEKLPTLQDGAHPWISKLEEVMIGTQPAKGDIKRLLANLLGVHAMEEILQKGGLHRYVGTAVYDPELFAANRGKVWRALKDTFPTNVHPDNILIEPLGQEENPRAYVSRAHQMWRNVTGNDPDLNQMERSILRLKILKGLPLPVRSKLAEVLGLGSMAKGIYTDHIAHHVELYRKKVHDQEEQDQEIFRKLNQIQLMDNKKKDINQVLVIESQSPPNY